MDLILWRHAEAEDGIPDLSRALTPKGAKQAHKMAAFLHTQAPEGARILVSPARRTQETAQALTRQFETIPSLAPGASPRAILEAAGWPDSDGCVLIVGHQPTLGEAAALIMTGHVKPWSIRKGAVWWFYHRDRGDDETVLRLVLAPEHL